MAKATLYNMQAESVGEIELDDNIFAVPANKAVMHRAVVTYLANQRQGTQSALTRAEVSGGGRKPWRQKGTGRARQGSIRSPQWTHGGIVFAPKPRDYTMRINKKARRLALCCALSSKLRDSELIVIDDLSFEGIKTKQMAALLARFGIEKTALVALDGMNETVIKSARNLPGITTMQAGDLNTYQVLKHQKLIVTKAALDKMEEVCGR